MHGRICFIGLTIFAGCGELPAPPAKEPTEPAPALGASFDPSQTGTIRGRVTWDGDVPVGAETLIRANAFNPYLYQNPVRVGTPHLPKVHPANRGVGNAVVFLRGIDPQRGKPWDHAPVHVAFQDRQFIVMQGKQRTSVGFVQGGGAIEAVNLDAEYHTLRAGGAAFFAMPLIQTNEAQTRVLSQAGLVELSCAAGCYWLHAHLFVAEHPYYARTDADGRFTLEQVPAGTYEIVCWMPNWHVARKEYDPETCIIARWVWAAPREQVRTLRVEAGGENEIAYQWSPALFVNTK